MNFQRIATCVSLCCVFHAGCDDAEPYNAFNEPDTTDPGGDVQGDEAKLYDFANSCVTVKSQADGTWLAANGAGDGYGFDATSADGASNFFLKASDLGMYLLFDEDGGYVVSEDGTLIRQTELDSSLDMLDDNFVSGAEWRLEFAPGTEDEYVLKSRRLAEYIGANGLVADAGSATVLSLDDASGCTEHPEMTVDAEGTVTKTTYEDGDLFGFVDTHSHILSNFGFGGGGVFHGAPFHRLGVAEAMGSCEPYHGPEGRADLLGFGFSGDLQDALDVEALLPLLTTGELTEAVHATDGWPTFSDWPSRNSSTHQTQYYRWLERSWKSGLRVMVQHMVTNEALCDLMADTGFQPTRWGCEDMLNVDRQIMEIYRMERYIDAQNGGPGEGWFRVVETPEEARQVVGEGKLAIILGIEVPNLFECYLTRRENGPECDAEHIQSELDRYYEMGIRALFPVHKYDNAFSPGDGDRGIFELGSFLSSGHYSNYTNEDCPDVPTVFDKGDVQFGGLNQPRENYLAEPAFELIQLTMNPAVDLLPYLGLITEGPLEGDYCQKAGLTDKGVELVEGIMARGMILEIDHLPRRSYIDAFEMLVENDYPAAGTHGNTNDGKLYELGGISKSGFGRCPNPEEPGDMARSFRQAAADIAAAGGYPAEGFGFDLNGFAGVRGPRFGENGCTNGQDESTRVTYPFTSYGGDVTFTEPQMGERVVDFNDEGFIHIGMTAELIEDARRTGVTDEDLDILFKSAEGYIRMWELAQERGAAISGASQLERPATIVAGQ